MKNLAKAAHILRQIGDNTKLGDLRKIANDIKKDHELAVDLWSSKQFLARQLAILIMDKKLLTPEFVDQLDKDIMQHEENERMQLIDWLMANQFSKDKNTIALMNSWENSPSSLQRRAFWYYQGRLRWVGQKPAKSEELLTKIESSIEKEAVEVQWAMNFTAGWIGVYEKEFRSRCIALGEKTGLYKEKLVSKGCTPEYLPEFIRIESIKRNL